MPQPTTVLALATATLLTSAVSLGAEDGALGKDLKATIALQGMSCDRIVEAKRTADSDYTAACNDGNRYHVFVNADGRVVVQKLTP